ncbi:MFS transporter [Salinispora oceanensis]|uniref:MFS transporter n=1 Tax=Salinispora oceanensis TaxID=1050199 RepID=UPI0003774CDA|nr:MFS transporter [Salinispora oceanensis]
MTYGQGAKGPAITSTFRQAPLAVKTILAGVFINRLSGFLNIFLVLYLLAEGYSTEQAALALGVYGGGAVVGVLIGGGLADRLGARNATVISMASSSVLIASLLFLPNYPMVLLAVALVGLGGQLYRPASATLLSELTPHDQQVMIFAMYRFGLNLGAMAAPLLGFALYNLGRQQYELLFWGEAAIALLYAGLAWVALPARSRVRPTVDPAEDSNQGSYSDLLRDRRFLSYLVATFLHSAVYVQYLSTLPLDMTAEGTPIFWYTAAVSLNGFIVIAFELLLTKVTQNWPFKVTIGLAFGLLGAGVAFYALPLGPAIIIGGTLIWSLGEIIGGPAAFAYPAVAGPASLKSRYIGSFQFMFGLGTAVGPMAGGWLFVQLGHSVWLVIALSSVLATLLAVTAVRQPRGEQPAIETIADAAADREEPPVARAGQ